MRTVAAVFCVAVGVLLWSQPVSSQGGSTLTLDVEQLMTAQELRATGVAGLTAEQKAALGRWLASYSISLLRSASSSQGGTYSGLGGGHWVSERMEDGEFIVLEDGSLWQIIGTDRIDTSLWLATTSITVIEADAPVADYKYLLLNTDDGEKALAKYRGHK